MAIKIDYDYQKTYLTDELLSVGTTTEMYRRGELPQPSPDNTNSIWLAPNGSDSNAGTEALPVLTLANAVSKMGAAKLTCHIFRNGYVGDIVFNETVTAAFLDTYNLQVEEGERATITNTQLNYITMAGTVKINGIRFLPSDTPPSDYEVISAGNTCILADVRHCDFIFPGEGTGMSPFSLTVSNTTAYNQAIVKNNYIYSFSGITTEVNTCIIENNLIIANKGNYTGSQDTIGIAVTNNGAKANSTNFYRNNYIIGFEFATQQFMFNASTPTGNTHNFDSCLFLNNDFTITTNAVTSGGLDDAVINFDYCLMLDSAFIDLSSTPTQPATFVTNITNLIDSNTPLKLIDQKGLLTTGDKESAELQFNGKSTPDGSGKYFLDSPLIGLGRVPQGTLVYKIINKPYDSSSTLLRGIDIDPDGTLWILDGIRDRIYNIYRSGVKLSEFNTSTLLGGASSPRCVAYDTTRDTLWFSDQTSQTITQTQTTGSSVITSFAFSSFDGSEVDISGISYEESTDSLWMTGDFNNKIYNVTMAGALISSFLTSAFDGSETVPTGIAVGLDSTLWITGGTNDKIYNTTRTGSLLSSFDSNDYDSTANGPRDLTIDKNGYMWIVDDSGSRIFWIVPDGIVDLSPFTEITTLLTSGFSKSLDFDYPAASIDVPHNYINPVNISDVTGDPHGGYDAERREFVLSFGGGIQVSNIQWKKLRDMFADKGTKKLFPLGASTDLFTPATGSTAGTFSNTDNSVSPTSAITVNMVPDHWRGFWVVISGLDYYISSNDTLKMYLIDPLGNGFPSNGAVTFQAQYILVNTEVEPFAVHQDNYRGFTDGQGWRESTDTNQPYDFQIENIKLKETSTLEENI